MLAWLSRRLVVLSAVLAGLALCSPDGTSAQPTPDDATADTTTTATHDLAWLSGTWAVSYQDDVLGQVTGFATIASRRPLGSSYTVTEVSMVLLHPTTGARYSLRGGASITERGAGLEITLSGDNPPSGKQVAIEPPVPGAQRLKLPIGMEITAGLDGSETSRSIFERSPGDVQLLFSVRPDGPIESLSGRWQYLPAWKGQRRTRAGRYDPQTGIVSGLESWTRLPPSIALVVLASDQSPIHQLPLGSIWLSIVGENLPVQPRRVFDLQFRDGTVVPTGRYRPNGRYPTVLDVEVIVRKGLDSTPKKLVLNGEPGVWLPDLPGLEPVAIRYLRKTSGAEFEAVDTVHIGEVFYVEAEYAEAPVAQRQIFMTKGAGRDQFTYPVERVGDEPSEQRLFRSGRLLLMAPGESKPDASSVRSLSETGLAAGNPVVVRGFPGSKLQTAEFDAAEPAGGKTFGLVDVAKFPPTLWDDALAQAQRCRDSAGAETEASNYIITNVVVPGAAVAQTIQIGLAEHAAAILIRDELRQSLGKHIASLNAASPIDQNAVPDERRRQLSAWEKVQNEEALALIAIAESGAPHPLMHVEVTVPGEEWITSELRSALTHSFHAYRDRDPQDQRQFLEQARRKIAEAKGKMAERGSRALDHVTAPGACEVKKLLMLVRVGLDPVVARLLPKLVRPARGDEPPYPRYVPDQVPRAAVKSLHTLAQAIQAQQEHASADTDVVLALTSLATMGAGSAVSAAVAAGRVSTTALRATQAGMTAVEAYDAYQVYGDAKAWVAATHDREFALGISSVAGTERLGVAQQEAREALFKLALSAGLSIGPNVVEGIGAGRIELPQGLGTGVARRAMQNGVGSLGPIDQALFNALVKKAREQAASGGIGSLSATDRQLLGLANAQARAQGAVPARPPGAGVAPGASGPPAAPSPGSAQPPRQAGMPVPTPDGMAPIPRQCLSNSCGVATARATINRLSGRDVPEQELIRWSVENQKGYGTAIDWSTGALEGGTWPQGMVEVLEGQGVRTRVPWGGRFDQPGLTPTGAGRVPGRIGDTAAPSVAPDPKLAKKFTLDDAARERRDGNQVLTVVRYASDRPDTPHWVVIEKVGSGRVRDASGQVVIDGPYVIVGDPATGHSVAMSRADFERHWYPDSTVIALKPDAPSAPASAVRPPGSRNRGGTPPAGNPPRPAEVKPPAGPDRSPSTRPEPEGDGNTAQRANELVDRLRKTDPRLSQLDVEAARRFIDQHARPSMTPESLVVDAARAQGKRVNPRLLSEAAGIDFARASDLVTAGQPRPAPRASTSPSVVPGELPRSARASYVPERGQLLHDVVDQHFKGKAPALHVTDRAGLEGITRSGVLEQPKDGGPSWSRPGIGTSREGNVAIRIKPGHERYIEFVEDALARGLVPKHWPSGQRGVGKSNTYVPTERLQYLEPGNAPGQERWVDFPPHGARR